jgi:hypothetical protein
VNKGENLLHINHKETCLSFSRQDVMIPKRLTDSRHFHSSDMEQVDTGIIGLRNRFKCLLKCNFYTSLIDLDNFLNEFI